MPGRNLNLSRFEFAGAEFKRVLSNILNNSIEAIADRGHVLVTLEQVDDHAELTVSDSGNGIPAEILPKLMARGASFGKSGGSGLGLHYAKKMMEKWGGTILLKSTEGQGTTVRMTIPVRI